MRLFQTKRKYHRIEDASKCIPLCVLGIMAMFLGLIPSAPGHHSFTSTRASSIFYIKVTLPVLLMYVLSFSCFLLLLLPHKPSSFLLFCNTLH